MPTRHELFPLYWQPERLRRFLDWDPVLPEYFRVEEFKEGDHYVIKAELPGIDPMKDFEITVSEGVLRIRARRVEETHHTEKESYHSEFKYGELVRELELPMGAKPENINATYKDGLLEILVPLEMAVKPEVFKVPVKAA